MEKFDKKTGHLIVEKYLPHNFLAEKIILSSLLNNSDTITLISQTLSIESFYFKNHQEIYKAVLNMYNQNLSIDVITLTTYLQDNGLLTKIGGIKVLIELINQVPNLVYLEEYIKLIQDKFVRRKLIKLGYKIINSSYITNIPLEKILQDFELKLFHITNEIKNHNILSPTEIFSSVFLKLKEKSLHPNLSGLSSGFYDLDSLTQGFQITDLIIVAGRPSTGKTSLCLNIALNVLKTSKLPVVFFSLEMSKEQIIHRLIASEAKINPMKLRTGYLSKHEWLKLNKTITDLSTLLFFIDDSPNLSAQDIRLKIKRILFEQREIGIIIIDYLQLMQNTKSMFENRAQELSNITRSLKNIAREFNVPIVALSQLNRNVENRMNKRPILSDLRESGSIEQDADLILMLSQQNDSNFLKTSKSQLIELIIAKQRNGPIGVIQLKFNTNYSMFENISKYDNT